MSGVYTCNSCVMQFDSSESQRQHMKSDWHRYNLKRRVAQLPPITEATFNSKVQVASASSREAEDAEKKKDKKQLTKKEIRRREKEVLLEKKKKLLELARQNMLKNMQQAETLQNTPTNIDANETEDKQEQSKPEIPNTDALTGDSKQKEVAGKEEEEEMTEEQLAEKLMQQKLANKVDIPLEECLFCTKKVFEDFDTNLDHMFRNHGFYIPEQKYLEDKIGLVKYMSEKIGLGNVCIVCNYQGRSLEAVRAHMLAKRHCRIPYESENEKLEISEFYNFTSTYEGFDNTTKKPITVVEGDDNDEEWEDVDSEEEKEDEEEDEAPQEYLYHDNVELHLPTGIRVGHRSLQRYYKQDLRPEKELTEGQGTLMAAETRTFLPAFDKQELQVKQRVWKTEVQDLKRADKRKAKFVNNQPYYRDQLLQ
ncbi:hypothetical protein NCAS_0B07450 [Naumovozyma castellii]|uniref:C2H2-type domain-containing protein n=1 Tax=Naumovozyma castellii TaxID=27288 RepID=G0VA99_NAUCA|nr:hypothetical protein NCAS_0B07450 [Naumovozyma castellii CBS 4309]CCC68829.1 hypothetical protein NCAS_0B07450 [Naumovozyma castellii CBS 4309]